MKLSYMNAGAAPLLCVCLLLISACSQSPEKTVRNSQVSSPAVADSQSATDEHLELSLAEQVMAAPRKAHKMGDVHADFLMSQIEPIDQREQYAQQQRNRTIRVADQPVSTFSVDVDTGSYANVRRFLNNGQTPPQNAVRIEELLNYFDYHYSGSQSANEPFSVTAVLGDTPWNNNTQLVHIGLKGFETPDNERKSANLVFLIDVSGSMQSSDKLGLLKTSISLLTRELKETDTVSIAVYAGSSGRILEPTAGNRHQEIISALSRLQAGGSTNGAQGIHLAYQMAAEAYKPYGINRIILATDGDFNVGVSDIDQLKSLISKQRASGIALTTLGFGTGNYNDHLMEQLADVGDGAYAYIDTLSEARKVLVDELRATLMTIAKDVKIQIEFNPNIVSEYRLIGYSNRLLNNEDFSDDRVDAGEIGAGHTVTALYEIALAGRGGERHTARRYGHSASREGRPHSVADDTEIGEVRLRYKLPDTNESLLTTQLIELENDTLVENSTLSELFEFSASVAAFGQLLAGDTRLGSFNYSDARALAAGALGKDPFGYRAEFLRLVDLADSLHQLGLQSVTPGQVPDQG